MKEVLYSWVRNMVFYQMLISIVMNVIPEDSYRKYIRFFLGMLFIVIATQPVFQLFRLSEEMDVQYIQEMLEREFQENSLRIEIEDMGETDGEIP